MFVVLFVCLFICPQDFLQGKERICMKPIPEACLGPRSYPLDFRDDPHYDQNQGSGLRSLNRAAEVCSI